MKMDMRGWAGEFVTEPGVYNAVVTGCEQGTTKSGKDVITISFGIGYDQQYKQLYFLKDGKQPFFTKDCIAIMGSSERVLSGEFDTDEMLGTEVEITLTTWGENNNLTISNIKRLAQKESKECPF